MTDGYVDHAVAGQAVSVWKRGSSRLRSQLLLITTSVLLTDVHNYYAKLAICIRCQEVSITLSHNKQEVSAQASYHTSCDLAARAWQVGA